MRALYVEILYDYSPLIACIASLLLVVMYSFGVINPRRAQNLSMILLILGTIVSLEFYPFQISALPINIIMPIGLIIFFLLRKSALLLTILIGAFSFYLIFGLAALSSSSTTWGDGAAPFGVFIVPNSLIFLLNLIVRAYVPKLFSLSKIFIGIVGFVAIYLSSHGFSNYEFDGEAVTFRRLTAVIVCVSALTEAVVIYIGFQRRILKTATSQ